MKYKCGSLVTEATGKLGGHVFMGKGNGGVLRVKSTYKRGFVKSKPEFSRAFASLSLTWRSMSEASRILWLSCSISGLSGWNAFFHCNLLLSRYSLTLVLKPPIVVSIPIVSVVAVNFGVGVQSMLITLSRLTPSNHILRVFCSNPVSSGVSVLPSKYTQIAVYTSNVAISQNVLAQYLSYKRFLPIVGQVLFFGVAYLSRSTGITGRINWFKAVVT